MTWVGNMRAGKAPSDFAVQVSVIVLAYGAEPYLRACIDAILSSVDADGEAVDLELILVDNGAAAAVAGVGPDSRVRIVRSPKNLGFAGGCKLLRDTIRRRGCRVTGTTKSRWPCCRVFC